MSDVQIQITDNGPYKVTGDIELFDQAGNPFLHAGQRSLPVPLRRLNEQAVLRRNALQDRVPGCHGGGQRD